MMKFTGDGSRVVPGVPPKNLTKEQVQKYGADFLLSTGLYEKPAPKPKAIKGGK